MVLLDRFMREPEVGRLTGLSSSTRRRLECAGLFPRRHRIARKAVGWLESEIQDWIRARAEDEVPLAAVGGAP